MYKNVNTVSDEFFPHTPAVTPQHAGVIDQSMTSLSLAGDASTAQVYY